jgi:hypothetical protein
VTDHTRSSSIEWPCSAVTLSFGAIGNATVSTVSDISGSNAMQIAAAGISRGLAAFARDAQTVAQSVMPSSTAGNLASAVVDAMQQQLAIEASARMLVSTDATLGNLIDVSA